MRPTQLIFVCSTLLSIEAAPGGVGAQSIAAAGAAEVSRGRSLIRAGNWREAQNEFAHALQLAAGNVSLTAEAQFGRAFASQQRLLSGDTADAAEARALSVEAVNGFTEAARALPVRFAPAAYNNIGLVLRQVGQRRDAASYFAAAAAVSSPEQSTYDLRAAREFDNQSREDASLVDSARKYYTAALTAEPSNVDAFESLLSLQRRYDSVGVVLASAEASIDDSSRAATIAATMASLVARAEPSSAVGKVPTISRENAARALILFVKAVPAAHLLPTTTDALTRAQLTRGRDTHPALAGAIASVLYALAPMPPADRFHDPDGIGWWRASSDRRQAWNSLCRWIGDAYNSQNSEGTAESFYLVALDGLQDDLNAPWIDRDALLPLALIYAEKPAGSPEAARLSELTQRLYSAKGVAIANSDLPRMYDYHLTLAALYAARGQWSGSGADNAEFQMEHLRDVSSRLTGDRVRSTVPPVLLSQLAAHYARTNQTAKADQVTQELRTTLTKRGHAADVEPVIARIRQESQRTEPPTTQPFRRVTTPALVRQVPSGAIEAAAVIRSYTARVSGRIVPAAGKFTRAPHLSLVAPAARQDANANTDGTFSVALSGSGDVKQLTLHADADGFVPLDTLVAVGDVQGITLRLRPSRSRTIR